MEPFHDIFERPAWIIAYWRSRLHKTIEPVHIETDNPALAKVGADMNVIVGRINAIGTAFDHENDLRKTYDELLRTPAPPKTAASIHANPVYGRPEPIEVPSFKEWARRVDVLEKAHRTESMASDSPRSDVVEKAYQPAEFLVPLNPFGKPATPTFTSPPPRSHQVIPAGAIGFDVVATSPALRREIKRVFDRQAKAVLGAVTAQAVGDFDPVKIADAANLDSLKELVSPVAAELAQVARNSAEKAVRTIERIDSKKAVEISDVTVGEWAKDRAAELVGRQRARGNRLAHDPDAHAEIQTSTRNMLARELRKAKAEGLTGARAGVAIYNGEVFGLHRADLIAKTELATAHNVGLVEGFKAASATYGRSVKKEWVVGDRDKACPVCAENAKAGPITLTADFPSGDATPIAHPNCGCRLSFHIY